MALTPREQAERIGELRLYIAQELPLYALRVAGADLVALITNRVVQRGEDANGAKFSPYSRNTVAAWRFWGKSRTQAAEAKVRALARARGALSYEEFRRINNLNTNIKNFEFTGEMWRKFGVIANTSDGQRFRISLGGTTPAAQRKMDDNSDREGISIIEANEQEEAAVQGSVQVWIDQQANRILNG
jgi:hypothetical protein